MRLLASVAPPYPGQQLVPIVFAPLVGFSLGAAFAWVAAPGLARSEGPVALTPAFAVVAAFSGFVWLPAVGYFVAFHGDWSYLYLTGQRPSAIDLALVLLSGACVASGFLVVARPVRKRRAGPVLAAVGLPIGVVLGGLPFVLRRLAVSATYTQFRGDFGTEPIGSSLLGRGALLVGVVLAAAVVWTIWSLRVTGEP
jgi:hypothetical protein